MICCERIGKRPLVKSLEESEHPRSLSPYKADGGTSCDLRGVYDPVAAVAFGDGEQSSLLPPSFLAFPS